MLVYDPRIQESDRQSSGAYFEVARPLEYSFSVPRGDGNGLHNAWRKQVACRKVVGTRLDKIFFLVCPREGHDYIGSVEDTVRCLMRRGKSLTVDIFVIVHQDADSCRRMMDRYSGDIGILKSAPKNMKSDRSKILVHVTRNRIRRIGEVSPKFLCGQSGVSFEVGSRGNETEASFRYVEGLLQHLLALTEVQKLENRTPIGFPKLRAVPSIKGFCLLGGG